MFDNPYVDTSPLLDSSKNVLLDSKGREIDGRLYSGLLAKFMEGLPPMFEVSSVLRSNGNHGYYSVQDFVEDNVKDHADRNLEGRDYSTERILDSGNNPISCQAFFLTPTN